MRIRNYMYTACSSEKVHNKFTHEELNSGLSQELEAEGSHHMLHSTAPGGPAAAQRALPAEGGYYGLWPLGEFLTTGFT